jgi:hypothetical protein
MTWWLMLLLNLTVCAAWFYVRYVRKAPPEDRL